MGGSGGKKAQKKAKKDPLASSPDVADEAATPCKAALKVKVIRGDTHDIVEKINVKAGELGPEATATGTGIADFGDVEAASYKIAASSKQSASHPFRVVPDCTARRTNFCSISA